MTCFAWKNNASESILFFSFEFLGHPRTGRRSHVVRFCAARLRKLKRKLKLKRKIKRKLKRKRKI